MALGCQWKGPFLLEAAFGLTEFQRIRLEANSEHQGPRKVRGKERRSRAAETNDSEVEQFDVLKPKDPFTKVDASRSG